jgi:DNA ligase-1
MIKPMKPPAGSLEDADLVKLRFPLFASPKLDGLRASVQGGVLLSSTLKPIPNLYLQAKFGRPEFEGLDGELIEGTPNADPFNRTTSVCMSIKFEPTGVHLWVFDYLDPTRGYEERLAIAKDMLEDMPEESAGAAFMCDATVISNQDELELYELACLEQGYEGTMLRAPNGLHKQGRSTMTDQGLLRRKPFADGEATITGTFEAQENTNEAIKNELGRTKRSTAKAGKVGKGTLGGYHVTGLTVFPGVEFDITAYGDQSQRQAQWNEREILVGQVLKFKYQKYGSKDAPRLPIALGFRALMDISG